VAITSVDTDCPPATVSRCRFACQYSGVLLWLVMPTTAVQRCPPPSGTQANRYAVNSNVLSRNGVPSEPVTTGPSQPDAGVRCAPVATDASLGRASATASTPRPTSSTTAVSTATPARPRSVSAAIRAAARGQPYRAKRTVATTSSVASPGSHHSCQRFSWPAAAPVSGDVQTEAEQSTGSPARPT
jgi:hypothetical protein